VKRNVAAEERDVKKMQEEIQVGVGVCGGGVTETSCTNGVWVPTFLQCPPWWILCILADRHYQTLQQLFYCRVGTYDS
jgi:hypothetical protein